MVYLDCTIQTTTSAISDSSTAFVLSYVRNLRIITAGSNPGSMSFATAEREMEQEALLSIYEEQFNVINQFTVYEIDLHDHNTKIKFTLPERYPQVIPSISAMQGGLPVLELESVLYNSAQRSRGDVMIYNLIENAKEWIAKFKPPESLTLPQEDNKSADNMAKICTFFLEGKCRFGSRCINRHEMSRNTEISIGDASLMSKTLGESGAKMATDIKKGKRYLHFPHNSDGVNPKSLEEGSKKKSSMKTASDVISRIKWDEELSPEDFSVGYLDRFVGIVEKSFTEFSWEDLAAVDHFIDLAIPRHRIQYFKYLGEIVWDKRNRTDKVFGSTGGKETIMDVMQRAKVSQERGKERFDSYHELEAVEVSLHQVVHDSKAQDFTEEKRCPNYFLAVQITDSEVITNISKIQNTIQAALDPGTEYELIPSQRLHLTLLVLTLGSEEEISHVKNILKSVQAVMFSFLPQTHKLQFNGIGLFRDRILYARVEPDARLSKLVQILKFKFGKAGVSLQGNKTMFVPHVSILRCTRNNGRVDHVQKNFMKVADLYKDYMFGEQCVQSLVLYSKFLPKDADGTHQQLLRIDNSLMSLSSTLPKKLMQYVTCLSQQKKINDDEKSEIQALLQSGNSLKVDMGLARIEQYSYCCPDRVVLIIRGIPGSGKTFLVENSLEAKDGTGLTYCNSQQLFQRPGVFHLDQEELNIAEGYCLTCFMDALVNLHSFIVVDGVYAQCWEYAIYRHLAHVFGYACHVLEIEVTDPEGIKLCHQNCAPRLPLEQLLEHVEHWETDPAATIIEPWFKKPKAEHSQFISLKKLLRTV